MPMDLSHNRFTLLFVASIELLRARLRVARWNSPAILAELLGESEAKTLSVLDVQLSWVENVAWSLQAAAPRLPFRTNCLVRVLAGHEILRRAGVRGEVTFQAGKDANGAFEAHVWLKCSDILVSGGPVPYLRSFEPGHETQVIVR
jgi:hypothetical protein